MIPDVILHYGESHNYFMDCWLLTNHDWDEVDYDDELKRVGDVNWDLSVNNSRTSDEFIFQAFEYIRPAFNGYARCIHY